MERPSASSEDARIGSAAFFAPDTRTSPRSRAPPRMTIFCTATAARALGGRGALGRLLGRVLRAQPAQSARLATPFLGADLVAVLLAELGAAPADEVLPAVALGAHRLLALGCAALHHRVGL